MVSPPELERRVVLVVDDSPSSLGMLCDVLEAEGFTVLIARDGASALSRLELVSPDAILLDAVMPGLSGFEVCRIIKANSALAHIPIVFMTGLAETTDVLRGFDCGGVDYVVKPLRAQEVVARLQTHTRNARLTRLARQAVDVAGFGVVLTDSQSRISWCSPQAAIWLALLSDTHGQGQLPDMVRTALQNKTSERGEQFNVPLPEGQLSVRNMGTVGMGETMLFLEQLGPADHASETTTSGSRLGNACLTPRESEVK